jgi:hypothetical protein
VANQASSIPEREEVLRHPDKVWTDPTYAASRVSSSCRAACSVGEP